MGFVPPESILELDQEDIAARLQADSFFQNTVPVLLQRRGITEKDVQISMQAMQPGSVCGTVAIVMMPSLIATDPNAPGPVSFVRYGIQVIDFPIIRRQSPGGAGVSAEEICDRIRQIIHRVAFGRGQALYFDGLHPIPVVEGQVSYGVYFKCRQIDAPPPSCATVGISPVSGAGPLTITLSCATAGAAIYYSLDGSYPSSVAAAATPATSFLYSAPFTAAAAAFIRAAAEKTDYQQGNVAQVQYT